LAQASHRSEGPRPLTAPPGTAPLSTDAATPVGPTCPAKAGPAPQAAAAPEEGSEAPGTPPALRAPLVACKLVVTLNVRGLQGSQAWCDVQALAADYNYPDLIALTETKQKRKTTFHGPMKQLY
jgi:hypothetical protein